MRQRAKVHSGVGIATCAHRAVPEVRAAVQQLHPGPWRNVSKGTCAFLPWAVTAPAPSILWLRRKSQGIRGVVWGLGMSCTQAVGRPHPQWSLPLVTGEVSVPRDPAGAAGSPNPHHQH